jgi:hypothetical protein
MRYYVTTPQGEKGPYEEEHVREWLRAGTMPNDASVRREDEAMGRPASIVFPGETAPGGFGPAQPPFGASPGGYAPPQANVYAPPVTSAGGDDWVRVNTGSFGQGFVFGFFCGCIALIWSFVSSDMGTETKRGVRVGFAVGFAIGMVFRLIALASQH